MQTSFIGDVILATAALESLHTSQPDANIDVVVRKGNEGLFSDHPFIREIHIWDKKQGKSSGLLKLAFKLRRRKYDLAITLHRFASSGLLVALSKAQYKAGFDKNPLHMFFSHGALHSFDGRHEVERNFEVVRPFCAMDASEKPRLYPTASDEQTTKAFKSSPYVCIAPTSVWFTKQWPAEKWIELINNIPKEYQVFLLGGPRDREAIEKIKSDASHPSIINVAGKLSLLQSAVLMKDAEMNYVNDSAPMHLCSATNAPVTVVYCSTVPGFGFGPLSDPSAVVEIEEKLTCRPCGLHGHKACPEGHFKCAKNIEIAQVLQHD